MNAAEPIADLVTGSLAARAVEPEIGTDGGVDRTGHTTERACLNCATPLVGEYCHQCGQRGHVHRSLGAFGHDLLHGVFHFEGKIWRTLPMLAWWPGDLTRRYIEGERARFVGPLPLFLFCVFLMFAVVSQTTGKMALADPANLQQSIANGIPQDEARLRALQAERARAAAAGDQTRVASLDKQIASRREDLDLARAIATNGAKGVAARASDDIPSGLRGLEDAYRHAMQNPELLIFKLKSNGYKYSWALIPLSLPVMWLLFPFSRRWRMYDHTVFVTYSLCFVSLLVVVGSLWRLTGLGGLGLLLLLPPVHMYRQLRGAYSLSRPSALWRAVALTFGAMTVSILFAVGLLLLGVFD